MRRCCYRCWCKQRRTCHPPDPNQLLPHTAARVARPSTAVHFHQPTQGQPFLSFLASVWLTIVAIPMCTPLTPYPPHIRARTHPTPPHPGMQVLAMAGASPDTLLPAAASHGRCLLSFAVQNDTLHPLTVLVSAGDADGETREELVHARSSELFLLPIRQMDSLPPPPASVPATVSAAATAAQQRRVVLAPRIPAAEGRMDPRVGTEPEAARLAAEAADEAAATAAAATATKLMTRILSESISVQWKLSRFVNGSVRFPAELMPPSTARLLGRPTLRIECSARARARQAPASLHGAGMSRSAASHAAAVETSCVECRVFEPVEVTVRVTNIALWTHVVSLLSTRA